ncbi:MAG: hypothetical protein A2Y38_18265 [Spirochaetes bacterium GWB1_59_5]|nr:MAG: hypothetical protein A2Y38_18265 [Spirochaetes bacterium GWB1_59_5]
MLSFICIPPLKSDEFRACRDGKRIFTAQKKVERGAAFVTYSSYTKHARLLIMSIAGIFLDPFQICLEWVLKSADSLNDLVEFL